MAGYKGGRITRIKLIGFMTYDELELKPKPGLNLIMGLNGSGKSSIMSGICLGLAGKPQYTGKSAQLSDFIKMGHTKATIEIELENPRHKNVVITRNIMGEKSSWYLNGSPKDNAEVTVAVKKFNIDIGNLCQFLPQEKVADFSKMDKKQRLENMLQAIGDPKLFSLFEELKKLTLECQELEEQLKRLSNNKHIEEQRNEQLQSEVEKHEERGRLQEKLKLMLKKKTALEYQEYKDSLDSLKVQKNNIRENKIQLENQITELHENKNKSIAECQRNMNKIKESEKEVSVLTESFNKLTTWMSDFNEKVDWAKIEFKNRIEEKKNQKSKLAELKVQIKALRELEERNKEIKKELEAQTAQNTQESDENKNEMQLLTSKLEQTRLEENQYKYKLNSFSDVIESIKNEEDKKMEFLKQRHQTTYKAVVWLQQNRHLFKGTICLPAILTIKVHEEETKKFIENYVTIRDLITFVCEVKEDVLKLTKILNGQMNLRVNIAEKSQFPISDFSSPALTMRLKNLGIRCFMKDLFSAPDLMMGYLCELYKLHNIPICSSYAEKNMEIIMNYFSKFFTPYEKFSGSRSNYGAKHLSVSRDQIATRNILPNSKDNSAQLEIKENDRREAEENLKFLTQQRDAYRAQYSSLEKKLERLREERSKLLDKAKGMESVVLQLQQKIEMFRKKETEVVDEEEEKRKMTSRISSYNKEKLKILSQMPTLLKKISTLKEVKVKLVLASSVLSNSLSEMDEVVKGKETEFRSVEKEWNNIISEMERVKTLAKGLWEVLQTLDKNVLKMLLSDLGNLEELEQEIVNTQAMLELNSESNDEVVQDFQRRRRLIHKVSQNMKEVEENIKKVNIERQNKKNEWLPSLEFHITNINKRFTQYYKFLKCAGEISLDKTDNPDDFPKYGLQIRLKYRVDEDFQELSQTHHSGGECSVAAIIFILSLQELTEVPFRCIDEINQGMDAVNERKIYQLIADAAKGGSCSQYFLLTPKLLMDLQYHNDVAVHIIFNSQFLRSKLNFKKHLSIVKNLN